jgi:hypothetical protein
MNTRLIWLGAVALAIHASTGFASDSRSAKLGTDELTCMGAERAGNAAGTIPAFGGEWTEGWPGAGDGSRYEPGPYAEQRPKFVITAANMAEHAEHLTVGQKALLERYPDSFRMPVYETRRDFAYPQWRCDVVRHNADNAELVSDGLGFTGRTGAIPFPFPQNGLEAQWNMQNPARAWTEEAYLDQAVIYANGSRTVGRIRYVILSPWNHPEQRGSNQDRINSYYRMETMLPERDRGTLIVGWTPNDTSIDRQTWAYSPGTRRVRQAPEFGYDTPQGAGGFRTVDDDRLFNGSPQRYDWKLIGKKEMYMPFNAYAVNNPAIARDDLLKRNTINPEYMRYELRRVWVVEATVRDGYRHQYHRRTFYADEDSWHALWADNYDRRDQLWRASLVTYFWSPALQTYQAGVSVFHDLNANAYLADRMLSRPDDWWRLNRGDITANMFTPDAAQRFGH